MNKDNAGKKSPAAGNDLLELESFIIPTEKMIARARVVILVIVMASLVLRYKFNLFIYRQDVLFFIFIVYLLCSLLFIFFAPEKISEKHRAIFRASQLIVDLLFISLLIYFSGDIHSRLAFLYIIPVISAAIISLRAILITTGASFLLYYGLIYFIHIKNLTDIVEVTPPSNEYFSSLQLIRHGLTILIIAFAGFYYFENLKKHNERVVKLKDEFMFMVLHDIRSPATAIKWVAEKYRMPDFVRRYPEIQKDIIAIEESTKRIFTVSKSMLLLAKNQHIPVVVGPISIDSFIMDAIKEAEPGIIEKHIVAEYQPPQNLPLVSANADFLKEVLANIISNNIKYNKEGGKLTIYHKTENKFLRTSILNTGPRIEPENMKKLFYPFERGDMEDKIAGTGLGLYISRKIIEKMGGKIGVESSSDEKTIFYILLPLSPIAPKN